jgi:hypothetical protein
MWRARRRADLAAGNANPEEPIEFRAAPAAVITPPYLGEPDVATQVSMWLADVAVEAAARDHGV